MTDVVNQSTRSRMMAGIKAKDTRPEIAVRCALHAEGFRFRLHAGHLPGRPDIVLPRYRSVIMVHGCFWHRHSGCKYATMPLTRSDFWREKFAGTVARDIRNTALLCELGWQVITVWECELRASAEHVMRRVFLMLRERS